MSTLFTGFSATPFFPDHDLCFGDPSNTSSICQIPSAVMINFLNISSPGDYLDIYCTNPPNDSCAFGYCPNPDVASPAVRYSTYFASLVSAILVLYSPDDIKDSFYAQTLNVYSLIVAAMIAIGEHSLTRMHSVMALTLAASPLSLYLIIYVLRSLLGNQTRLQTVFGPGQHINRALVLIMLPLWVGVLVFTALPARIWEFQQGACDTQLADNHIARLFFLPFLVFFVEYPEIGVSVLVSVIGAWAIAVWRLREVIWAKHNKKLPLGRLWRKVVNHYPFIQFYTIIVLPHLFWIFNVEIGLEILSTREKFTATYGQLLAIFVTIPPFVSLCQLLPRIPIWFVDLAWVRLLTCRRNKPYVGTRPDDSSRLPIQQQASDHASLLGEKPDGLPGSPNRDMFRLADLGKAERATSPVTI
ncbi:hypothetical protein C8R46DRAFT_1223268 [Mycena filopes]|nr:hypothetical protein C8R46DRAFT_1223268 [Mycena filopes]